MHQVYRLNREEGLALEQRQRESKAARQRREDRFVAMAPNQAWLLDFVADQLQNGR
jgi:putative transposase